MEEATTGFFNEKNVIVTHGAFFLFFFFFREVYDSGRTIKDTPPSQFIAYTIFKDSSLR